MLGWNGLISVVRGHLSLGPSTLIRRKGPLHRSCWSAGVSVANMLRAPAGLASLHGPADSSHQGQASEAVQGLHRLVQADLQAAKAQGPVETILQTSSELWPI